MYNYAHKILELHSFCVQFDKNVKEKGYVYNY